MELRNCLIIKLGNSEITTDGPAKKASKKVDCKNALEDQHGNIYVTDEDFEASMRKRVLAIIKEALE